MRLLSRVGVKLRCDAMPWRHQKAKILYGSFFFGSSDFKLKTLHEIIIMGPGNESNLCEWDFLDGGLLLNSPLRL